MFGTWGRPCSSIRGITAGHRRRSPSRWAAGAGASAELVVEPPGGTPGTARGTAPGGDPGTVQWYNPWWGPGWGWPHHPHWGPVGARLGRRPPLTGPASYTARAVLSLQLFGSGSSTTVNWATNGNRTWRSGVYQGGSGNTCAVRSAAATTAPAPSDWIRGTPPATVRAITPDPRRTAASTTATTATEAARSTAEASPAEAAASPVAADAAAAARDQARAAGNQHV